jgi:hypothetical protein
MSRPELRRCWPLLYRTPGGGRGRPCSPRCPVNRARYDGGWEDELSIRTYCPAHLEALRDDLTPAITIETSAW